MINMTLHLRGPATAFNYCRRRGVDWEGPARSIDPNDSRPLTYIAHLPGGNIVVEFAGAQYVILARATKELA